MYTSICTVQRESTFSYIFEFSMIHCWRETMIYEMERSFFFAHNALSLRWCIAFVWSLMIFNAHRSARIIYKHILTDGGKAYVIHDGRVILHVSYVCILYMYLVCRFWQVSYLCFIYVHFEILMRSCLWEDNFHLMSN